MKKILAIVSYSNKTVNVYYNQIKNLFSDNLVVKKFIVDSPEIKEGISADLVLIPSYDAFIKVKDYICEKCRVAFINRTISEDGLNKIMGISAGTGVMLLDESLEMAKQMIMLAHQLGANHIDFIPVCPGMSTDFVGKTVIMLGESQYIPIPSVKVVNIGSSLIDISTIIDIGKILDLDDVINNQDIKKKCGEMATASFGLSEILGKINSIESQIDILIQVIGDGIIGIDSQGAIFFYNEVAEKITGYKKEAVIGKNGMGLLPQIPFKVVFQNSEPLEDKLIKINNDDVVVSVDPIKHSGKFYGAIAIIKTFNDAEKKQHRLRAQLIGKGHKARYNFNDIVGESDSICRCKEIAKRMASSNSSIFITGESGTGKELFAQSIHNNSRRKEYQFVAVNCGAFPESLLESELFGYEEGAFTGARKGGKPGLFELAHKGTLFLDEVGEMPLNIQLRLLRVLQERQVMRIGGDSLIDIDIRVIAATNKNIEKMIVNGEFREDLYYRLNVLPLKIPPLRERIEDIPLLMDWFKREFNSNFNLTEVALKALLGYSWRGNIRELKNYVEYLTNLDLSEINVEDLPIIYGENQHNETLSSDKEKTIKKLTEIAGKNIDKYIFVLDELRKGFNDRKRMGRRSICQSAADSGKFISEQEVRKILSELEELSMVQVSIGRSGTVITEYGERVLEIFKRENIYGY